MGINTKIDIRFICLRIHYIFKYQLLNKNKLKGMRSVLCFAMLPKSIVWLHGCKTNTLFAFQKGSLERGSQDL